MRNAYDALDPSGRARRAFLGNASLGLGALALRSLPGGEAPRGPHFAPRAKRVVYLFQAGGPSPFETFDPKPLLRERHGQPLPDSVRRGQRLTGMSGNQAILPLAGSFVGSRPHGRAGIEVGDLLPHTAAVVDRLCVVRSLHTEAINHDPAITFFCTGSQTSGRPAMGAWAAYGLGAENRDLPTFVVLVSKDAARDQPLYARLWGTGFLPGEYQGVQFRPGASPVLFLDNPDGVSQAQRRAQIEALAALHTDQARHEGDA
ncbi:MAG: DUF1501 domain-containing protein, partial [Planctomycetes bacterium]|nr:DUF1501 domain-containing protein [Planctomycetota bacterium]